MRPTQGPALASQRRRGSARELLRGLDLEAEDPGTAALIERLAHVRRIGVFTRAELIAMCRWKSPRAIAQYRRNRSATVTRVARVALAVRSERRRMELLTTLRGVSVPTASAILTLTDPRRYGVLDIRVWRLLFALRSVRANPAGRGFTVAQWLVFLDLLRAHARALGATCRAVEWALFRAHRARFRGVLYAKPAREGRRAAT